MVEEAMRTVGTNGSPVSWLHQRAVALIYDELTRKKTVLPMAYAGQDRDGVCREVRVRLGPDGELSGNLLDGVSSAHLPGEWDSIAGVDPDIILRDTDGNPVRLIEVVVTSEPSKSKQVLYEKLVRRGIEVVVTRLRTCSTFAGCRRHLGSLRPGHPGTNGTAPKIGSGCS